MANPTLLSRQSKPSSGRSVVGTGDTEVLEVLAVGCAPSGGWGVGDWGEHDYETYPPYQVDGNHLHQEFNVKIEPYIPDPSNFEVCGSRIQCCQPSRPSAISAGRTGRRQGRPSRPRPLRTACRPMTAGDGKNIVIGRHRAVTINTYIETVECAIQDINRFIYISRLTISSKHSGLV